MRWEPIRKLTEPEDQTRSIPVKTKSSVKSKDSQLSFTFTSHSILSICRGAAPASGSCSWSAPPRPPRPSWWSPAIGTLGHCQVTFDKDLPCSWSSSHTKREACYPGKTPGDQRERTSYFHCLILNFRSFTSLWTLLCALWGLARWCRCLIGLASPCPALLCNLQESQPLDVAPPPPSGVAGGTVSHFGCPAQKHGQRIMADKTKDIYNIRDCLNVISTWESVYQHWEGVAFTISKSQANYRRTVWKRFMIKIIKYRQCASGDAL